MATRTFTGRINVKDMEVTVLSAGTPDDFISLTDIARYKNPEEPNVVVANWLRNRNTIERIGWGERSEPQQKTGSIIL
jgi:hypothetical protein